MKKILGLLILTILVGTAYGQEDSFSRYMRQKREIQRVKELMRQAQDRGDSPYPYLQGNPVFRYPYISPFMNPMNLFCINDNGETILDASGNRMPTCRYIPSIECISGDPQTCQDQFKTIDAGITSRGNRHIIRVPKDFEGDHATLDTLSVQYEDGLLVIYKGHKIASEAPAATVEESTESHKCDEDAACPPFIDSTEEVEEAVEMQKEAEKSAEENLSPDDDKCNNHDERTDNDALEESKADIHYELEEIYEVPDSIDL